MQTVVGRRHHPMPETDGALGVLCTDHCLTCRGVGKEGVGKGRGKACLLE